MKKVILLISFCACALQAMEDAFYDPKKILTYKISSWYTFLQHQKNFDAIVKMLTDNQKLDLRDEKGSTFLAAMIQRDKSHYSSGWLESKSGIKFLLACQKAGFLSLAMVANSENIKLLHMLIRKGIKPTDQDIAETKDQFLQQSLRDVQTYYTLYDNPQALSDFLSKTELRNILIFLGFKYNHKNTINFAHDIHFKNWLSYGDENYKKISEQLNYYALRNEDTKYFVENYGDVFPVHYDLLEICAKNNVGNKSIEYLLDKMKLGPRYLAYYNADTYGYDQSRVRIHNMNALIECFGCCLFGCCSYLLQEDMFDFVYARPNSNETKVIDLYKKHKDKEQFIKAIDTYVAKRLLERHQR